MCPTLVDTVTPTLQYLLKRPCVQSEHRCPLIVRRLDVLHLAVRSELVRLKNVEVYTFISIKNNTTKGTPNLF